MNKKEQLYYLLKEFCKNKYDVSSFCTEYERVLYSDLPHDDLNEFELSQFYELGKIVVRFSPFIDDIENFPGVYYSKEEIEYSIKKTYNTLTVQK